MYIQRAIPRFAQCARHSLARRGYKTACFSVHGNEESWQGTLVQRVTKTVRSLQKAGLEKDDGAVVVLASRPYASWLLDEKFMAALLRPFGDSKSSGDVGREFNALTGAVDGLHPLRAFGDIPHGFSFYYGPKDMIMPRLWQGKSPNMQSAPRSNDKLNAAITFSYGSKPGSYVCTLPLANTIFQNGLQSTLIASRWKVNLKGGLDLVEREERRAQEVNIYTRGSDHTNSIQAPLVPITAPRKIVSGLGNIIRQVDVDGKETPASAELETAVQALFDRRTAEGHEFPPGPVGVWGVVCPPGDDQAGTIEFLNRLSETASKVRNAGDEWSMVLNTKEYMKWLINRGARVYKIQNEESGGGGWGKKAGLLSLDPEVKYSASSEEEDLDSFIRSFENRNDGGGDAEQGVIAPGSYIQYFVAPPFTAAKANTAAEGESQFTDSFGVTDDARLEASPVPASRDWKQIRHQFGAVTTHGLFLECRSLHPLVRETKLDVPGAWIGHLGLPDQKRSKFRRLSLHTEKGLGASS
ncbi:hypothetical protein CTAM01_00284 [Colletotrichum tamarilloi]|uniref:Uncharacterized protein n=1 Tax=Colletotrichum tamarilloi TaxID=1209934 RepID=A0ABQ9RU39_9PEZI|nr:uncharacterized protein CTAM01_00284 [Colletotrichum tamarilloi]KAK1512889.1 hypothetical protein CTAM01_00284 [Colletotrichum tamarilloi]